MNENINEKIHSYCKDHTQPDSTLLESLNEYTWENEDVPQMISGQLVGKFLQSIIQMIDAKKVIEVGTFTGYSALQMAELLPEDAELHTCEIMSRHIKTAKLHFNQSEYGKKIIIHEGPAMHSLENLKIDSFDLAFIDADKSNYLEYYQRCFMLVKQKGVIVLDNMLWSGGVINPQDNDSKALRNVGDFIQQDSRVFNVLLPIRDGLMVCIKKWKIKTY
mgnify:CR=1 FL=1